MIKLHCDVCDAVITDDRPRTIFKYYPNRFKEDICDAKEAMGFEQIAPVDATICENCLSHFTLADIVYIVKRSEKKEVSDGSEV